MTGTSTEHAALTIERQLKAPPARVFAAWADPTAKRQWFACHDEWVPLEYNLDFHVGGAERNHVADTDGVDWIEIVFQVVLAAVGVFLVAKFLGRRHAAR